MPVVIDEIQITATVTEPAERNETAAAMAPEQMEELKKVIIRECVEKVMEIIRDQNER